MGGGGKKGSAAGIKSPFTDPKDVAFKNDLGSMITKLLQGGPNTANIEDTAVNSLLGFNPGSYNAGTSGGNNLSPTGAPTGRPGGKGSGAGIQTPGSSNPFQEISKTSSGFYTDPTKNPFYSSQVKGATDAATSFLNKSFDDIKSSVGAAGGGVATSSALPAALERSAENVSSNLGGQVAKLQGDIYGQERGYQEGAARTGAGLLAELSQMPIDTALKYLSAIRGQEVPASPSIIGQLLSGGGQLAGGIGAFMGG